MDAWWGCPIQERQARRSADMVVSQRAKKAERTYKNGKPDGLWVSWHKNGQKSWEGNFKEGEEVEGSAKYWNSKGEPVESFKEAQK